MVYVPLFDKLVQNSSNVPGWKQTHLTQVLFVEVAFGLENSERSTVIWPQILRLVNYVFHKSYLDNFINFFPVDLENVVLGFCVGATYSI